MNWQQLTYFKAAAESKNYTRAAEQLYITPSALSKSIHFLEEEIGLPLFSKSGRNCNLTEYGEIFKMHVDQAMSCIDSGLIAMQRQANSYTGRVHLAGIYTMCAEVLPNVISEFSKSYPQATFSILYQITSTVLEEILSENADLGFCGDFALNDRQYAGIESMLIKQEPLIIITPKNHKLSEKSCVDITELQDENFIIYRNVNSGISKLFWELCENAKIKPHIAFEAPDDHTIIGLVAAGLGCAVIADSPSLRTENVHVLHFSQSVPIRSQYMIWKKGRILSPTVEAFRQYVVDFFHSSATES